MILNVIHVDDGCYAIFKQDTQISGFLTKNELREIKLFLSCIVGYQVV